MTIRIATNLDRESIHSVYCSAFAEDERERVSQLAVDLLAEETTPETFSLVAEVEGDVVGHVAFSPVGIGDDNQYQGYILAPLGVKPEFQKRRLGTKLIESGKQRLAEMNVDMLFVYGDPKYYSKFGFTEDDAANFKPPYKLEYPFGWQGVALSEHKASRSAINLTCVGSLSDPSLW